MDYTAVPARRRRCSRRRWWNGVGIRGGRGGDGCERSSIMGGGGDGGGAGGSGSDGGGGEGRWQRAAALRAGARAAEARAAAHGGRERREPRR